MDVQRGASDAACRFTQPPRKRLAAMPKCFLVPGARFVQVAGEHTALVCGVQHLGQEGCVLFARYDDRD